jgi:hypothetical protein
LNCDTPLHGPYCAACGQRVAPKAPTLHEFLHDFTHELLHVDGKIFQSVMLLLARPGLLTREYFEGRRVRYVQPIRLYLIFSVIYFAVAAIAPPNPSGNFNINFKPSAGETEQDVQRELGKIGFGSEEELQETTIEAINHWIPRAMFVLLPLFAGLVALTMRRSGKTYPQHLYFALHTHAAWFAFAAVSSGANFITLTAVRVTIQFATIAVRAWHVIASFKRSYSTTTAGAVWRSAVVGVAYFVSIIVALVAIVGVTIAARRFVH